MEQTIGSTTLELVTCDITQQDCDSIVKAANSRLAGGGGVDGAIRPVRHQNLRRLPNSGTRPSKPGETNRAFNYLEM